MSRAIKPQIAHSLLNMTWP